MKNREHIGKKYQIQSKTAAILQNISALAAIAGEGALDDKGLMLQYNK